MTTPQTSVIIPCRDAMRYLDDQLAALSDQRGEVDFEVILIDNGMNPGIDEEASRHPGLTIRLIDASDRPGTSYARNRGIAAAEGEYVLFCDSDDVVFDTWVMEGTALLKKYDAFNGGAVEIDAPVFDRGIEVARHAAEEQLSREDQRLSFFEPGGYPILLGCSFGMRRKLARELGGFDEAFGSQGEDNDLGFRLVNRLGRVPVARYVCVAYRRRPEGSATFSRGFKAGYKHALVCARHNAWKVSPSYQGHWMIRPARETLRSLSSRDVNVDELGRWIGCATGRVRYMASVPKPEMMA